MYEIEYYEDVHSVRLAKRFIDGMSIKMQAKTTSRLSMLRRYGPQLGMPYSRHLSNGIFELRVAQGNDAVRLLYFFVVGKRIVITHGFVKRTQKTPTRELKRAMNIREDWRKRNG